jgi:hypothetical protein
MPRLLHVMICVAVIAGVTISRPASARATKVAFTRIAGDTTGLGKAVAAALDDTELELVPARRVARAIDKLGLARLGDRELAKLAAELEVDAIVQGAFDRGAHRLRFTIFANGKKAKPFTVQVGKASSDKFRKLVRGTLMTRLAAAVPAEPDAPEGDDDQPARSKARHKGSDDAVAETDDRPKPKARVAKAAAATADDDAAPAEPPADPATAGAPRTAPRQVAARDDEAIPSTEVHVEGPARGPAHSANLAALRLELGASMSGRTLRFTTTTTTTAPMPYKNAPVPGGRIEGELYPFALLDPTTVLAGLGVAGDFDQVAVLTLRASAEMTVPLKTTERHYAVGLRYRIAFGHTATSPTLTLGGGYGHRSFVVDRKGLMTAAALDLPDVDYQLFDPGLAFRLPLGGRLAVTLGGRALLVTSAGPIQRADQYGPAKILGGTASASLELILGDRIALRVAGEATQLDLTFAGTGTLATSRDGNASTIDVRGATDRYLGGVATLAVMY